MPVVNELITEKEKATLLIVAESLLKAKHEGRHDGIGKAIVGVDFYRETARRAGHAIKRIVGEG